MFGRHESGRNKKGDGREITNFSFLPLFGST